MAELKPGEFLITRDQHRRLMYDILTGSKRIENEVMAPHATDPDAFTRALADLGPATSADLAELDAVPEPTDSDAPREVHQAGAAKRQRTVTSPSGQHVIPIEDDGTRWDQEP